MSLLRFLFLYTYVLVCGIQSFAQFGDCIYQYELEQPSELIHEIKLPPTAFANVYGNPYNFRVYGVAETGDTLEMPYAYPAFKASSEPVQLKQLNAGRVVGGDRFTFEAEAITPIQSLFLDIANRDFEGTVDLEGANQLGDWQTILRDYRILDVSKNGNPYRFTTVNFNSSSYRYYRVSINGIEKLSLINVSSNVLSKERRDTMFFNGVLQELPKLKRFPKTSVYDFKLAEDVLIDQLNFAISDTLRYVRKVEIQILQDSFPQGDEMRYRYRTIGSGSVSSFDTPQVVGFTATVSDRLRILVHNQDSQPLELVGVTAAVEQPRINVRFSGGKRYFLAFGCNSFLQSKPHYDVGQELAAHHGRPPSLNLVTLNSFAVQSSQDPIKGLLTNQLWLYAALVLIAVLLGWMAIGMMKK